MEPKKARHGFRVGPANLPDGPWRRKVDREKRDLIEKAKVKKQYAKIKARQQQPDQAPKLGPVIHRAEAPSPARDVAESNTATDAPESAQPQIHPQRQAMLDEDEPAPEPDARDDARDNNPRRRRQRGRPPPGGGYEKELAEAARKKQEAEERAAERARREEERSRRTAERERHRRAMAKARTPGRNGHRKLGRESFVLLDKVKRLVG